MQLVQVRATASLIAALAMFGVLLFTSTALAAPKEGPIGPTGPTGATGATGATGPAGKTPACLPSKATETGVWFASLAEPAGAPQDEVDGVVSYPIPLCRIEGPLAPSGVEAVYLTEEESFLPLTYTARGCEGDANEAGAQPGHLCMFTAGRPGFTENVWKNAKFREMDEPDGVFSEASGTHGDRAVFLTKGFIEDGTGTVPAGGAMLAAGGPWAVTAK